METFAGTVPAGWTVNDAALSAQITQQGLIHSGNSAVSLSNGAVLSQDIPVTDGCFYDFSFFARGDGNAVGLTATVTFLDAAGQPTDTVTIPIRSQDSVTSNRSYGYYRVITPDAPADTTTARISFAVTSTGGQSLDLDDVSFTGA